MDSFFRTIQAVWRYKAKVLASVLCAVFVSAIWASNLSATYPIIRVLFENDSLQSYVDTNIERVQADIDKHNGLLAKSAESNLEHRERILKKLQASSNELINYKWLKSDILPWVPDDKFKTVIAILSMLVIATLLKGVFLYIQELLVGSFVFRTANDIRRDAFENCSKLDIQSLQTLGTSEVTSRLTNDVTVMSDGYRLCATILIREPLKAICCIAAAMWLNWRLTSISILTLPMMGFVFYRTGRTLRRVAIGTMERMGNIYKKIAETFDSSRVMITHNAQSHHSQQLQEANQNFYSDSMRLIRAGAVIKPSTELLGVIAFIAILAPGAFLVLNETDEIGGVKLASGPLTIAELTTLYVLMAGVLDPMRKLSAVFPVAKRALAAADRIFAITDKKPLVVETQEPVSLKENWDKICFEDIHFQYEAAGESLIDRSPAINGVDLTIQRGQVVAVVGGNGSGKSTLLSLLPRLMDAQQGTVKLGDVDIKDLSLKELREQIAVVSQETTLFDDNVIENIQYGNFQASRETIIDAIRQAHAFDFVEMLPEGLETELGEGGRRLSGGQRQRLALARAIVRDPEILILDEATSAIDAESEDLIHGALQSFCKDRTVFMISHLLSHSFLDLVDRIIVMEAGQIVADGTHESLMKSSDHYQRLLRAREQSPRAAA